MTEQTASPRRQFITFRSGTQEFGADIMMIREIRGWTQATPLPHAPEYIRGVINLRGIVLPIVDLQARLGRGGLEVTAKHVVVVVKVGERTIGLLVDAVSDILTIAAADIQPPPEIARDTLSTFVEGIAIVGERMVTLLSMEWLTASLVGQEGLSQAA